MAEKTVMDEVNAALGDAFETPEPEEETPAPEGETPEGESETPEGESETPESEPEGEEEGEPEGEEKPEGEVGPNGERERNPDGTWKAAEKPKLDKDGKPIVEPKKVDPVNDPIPKDLKKETSERIRTLIDTTKTVTAERDQLKQDFDYLVKGVEATGTSPEQYGETLSWLALFNSNNPQQQEKALELIETVAERLATLLGKDRTVGDPLAAHSDLKEAVAKGQITAQYAKEIARTRNGQQFRTELTTSAQKQAETQETAQREEYEGRTALTELENTLRASDPDYEAKKAVLVPALKPLMVHVPWKDRKAKFLEAYKNVQLPRTPKPAVRASANQPLRAGKQPAGGQTKAPSSMLEAIGGALNEMNNK